MSPKKRARRKRKTIATGTKRQIGAITQICIGLLLLLSLWQEGGLLGNTFRRFLTLLFGSWGALPAAALIVSGFLQMSQSRRRLDAKHSLGLGMITLAFLGMIHMQAPLAEIAVRRDELAGVLGFMVSAPLLLFMSRTIGYTILGSVILIGVVIAFEPDPRRISHRISSLISSKKRERSAVERKESHSPDDDAESDELDEDEYEEEAELNIIRPMFAKATIRDIEEDIKQRNIQKSAGSSKEVLQVKDMRFEEWTFPGLDLLDSSQSVLTIDDEELKRQAKLIEEKLREFEIEVVVRDARPGPTVTQFTLDPAEGVKLSKIANLKNDLALALAAQSLRIEAPIPGKSLVGVEMPNSDRTIVHLREILETEAFTKTSSQLTIPLGRDVSGEAIIADLCGMPHLLLAGATGSGKSVCMNVFLLSLLYQNAPHELKLILIDPKRVELMPYDNIPHLLHPVIADAEKALQAFRWSVAEMGRRLHRFADAGVRNIDEYNEKQSKDSAVLPRIVIVIDELADLMMRQLRRDTEIMIVRIAQMARAVGIHLIISTQRPSVDVITGLIKANIPTRIAFRTVSSVDSRTILDGIGAEDLLGKGDMLLMTAETAKPVRIQGIYVSTKEVERVINAVKIAGGGRLSEQIDSSLSEDADADNDEDWNEQRAKTQHIDLEADDDGGDTLFFNAVRVVKESRKASASLLQRQLKVGYARAARLLDIMEEKGLIGPVDGAKPRKVFYENLEKVG